MRQTTVQEGLYPCFRHYGMSLRLLRSLQRIRAIGTERMSVSSIGKPGQGKILWLESSEDKEKRILRPFIKVEDSRRPEAAAAGRAVVATLKNPFFNAITPFVTASFSAATYVKHR